MAAVGVLLVLLQIVLLGQGSSLDGPKNLRAGDELQVKREGLFPSDSALKKLFSVLEKGAKVPVLKVKRETNVTLVQCGNSTAAACSVVNRTTYDQSSATAQLVGLEPAQGEVASHLYMWPPHHGPMTFPTRPPHHGPMTFPTRPPHHGPMTFPTRPPHHGPMTFPTRPPYHGPMTFPTRPPYHGPMTFPTRPPYHGPMTFLTRPPHHGPWLQK
nr:uncharacterized protein LOC129166592 [Nothobranchius furzeri]